MTTTVEHEPTRTRDAICPPWCTGHSSGWLPWELDHSRQPVRTHASPTFCDDRLARALVHVQLHGDETLPHGIEDVSVALYSDVEYFTADEARRLAKALLEAASVLEDAQAVAR